MRGDYCHCFVSSPQANVPLDKNEEATTKYILWDRCLYEVRYDC